MTERARSAHPATAERPGAARVDSGADHSAFPALDGLRAVAVAAVVLTHAAYWTGRTERGLGAAVLARMDVGVAVFFVISGFLLVRPSVGSQPGGSLFFAAAGG